MEGYLIKYSGLQFGYDLTPQGEPHVETSSTYRLKQSVCYFLLKDEGRLEYYDDKGGALVGEFQISGTSFRTRTLPDSGKLKHAFLLKCIKVQRNPLTNRVVLGKSSCLALGAPSEEEKRKWLYSLKTWNRSFFKDGAATDETVMLAQKYVLIARVGGRALKGLTSATRSSSFRAPKLNDVTMESPINTCSSSSTSSAAGSPEGTDQKANSSGLQSASNNGSKRKISSFLLGMGKR